MCFNPFISATFAIIGAIGAIGTIFAWRNAQLRKQHTNVLFAFYTVMETLQTIQYYYVNQCGSSTNRWLTDISFYVFDEYITWNNSLKV